MQSNRFSLEAASQRAADGRVSRRTAMLGAAAAVATPLLGATAADAAVRSSRVFRIARRGSDIGRHSVAAETVGDELRLSIDIEIVVRVLGIAAYRYEHQNTEVWRDGRLFSVDSVTNDDGTDDFCRVIRKGDLYEVDASRYSGVAPGDAAPTSYWNYANLGAKTWISTQGGRLFDIKIDRSRDASGLERCVVSGGLDLVLFYDADGEWRASEFDVSGDTIAYEEIEAGPRFAALI